MSLVPTLLTQKKMHPALSARIEASLHRRSGDAGRGIYRPRAVAVARFLGIVAAVATVIAIVVTQRRARQQFETRRSELLQTVEAQASSLGESERGMLGRAESQLRQLAGTYEGDFVAPGLDGARLAAILGQPLVYVRGVLNDFTGNRSIALATQDSTKDTFAYCLFDPPAARDEATLVAKVREVFVGGALEARTAQVSLLRDAEQGLPYLQPPWISRVKSTDSKIELGQLEQLFAHAPIEGAKKAARARHLLAALDEDLGGPSLEGDRAHDVRVALVDLASGTLLLRLRRRVDPSILGVDRRARYSFDVDGCTLAYDVRAAIAGKAP